MEISSLSLTQFNGNLSPYEITFVPADTAEIGHFFEICNYINPSKLIVISSDHANRTFYRDHTRKWPVSFNHARIFETFRTNNAILHFGLTNWMSGQKIESTRTEVSKVGKCPVI